MKQIRCLPTLECSPSPMRRLLDELDGSPARLVALGLSAGMLVTTVLLWLGLWGP